MLYLQKLYASMIGTNVDLDLMEFVEQNILPQYSTFDKSHQLSHVIGVINRSIELAKRLGINVNMAYAAAAYHDLGLQGPRAIHHITSGKILAADHRLRKWFSQEQIRIMREAVEDHRASTSHTPRNVYGRIVAEADRDLEPDNVFRRTIEFGLDHYPDKTKEQQWERFIEHLKSKFSEVGYMRLWIPNSPNEAKLREIRDIINDEKQLKTIFETQYDALTR